MDLDWTAALIDDNGAVDRDATVAWLSAAHASLAAVHGASWTDGHAAWLGRLLHDAVMYQGVELSKSTPDDLDDLLFTLQVSQRDSLPAPAALCVPTLRLLYGAAAEHLGSLHARSLLGHLSTDAEAELVAALSPAPAARAAPKRSSHGRRLPRRKKGRKKNKKR